MDQTKTIQYYNENARNFVDGTVSVDFKYTQDKFLKHLEQGAYILDFGCGSGRDTKYFFEHGFQVDATDGSKELCRIAAAYSGVDVKHMYFQELSDKDKYDGIWACSSILHLPYIELKEVVLKITQALKNNGVLYTSFKYGEFEGERNGRYFTDMTKERLDLLLEEVNALGITELWITSDVRPGRAEEKWLNVIMQKK